MTRSLLARRWVLGVLMLLTACSVSFTTAHISAFAISKDKDGSQPASTFGADDSIFAKAVIANNIGKVTLKWQLIAEKAEGLPEHKALSEADKSYDMNGDGSGTYSLTPPSSGWPAGTYVIKLSMLDDAGAEKDRRSATVTISGTPAKDAAVSRPRNAVAPKDGDTDDTAADADDTKSAHERKE